MSLADDSTRQDLALLLAVLARVTSDPALAFDMATEALAAGRRAAMEENPPPADEAHHRRCLLEAVERVFRTSVLHGRVPQAERRHALASKELSAATLAGISALGHEPLEDDHPDAQRTVDRLMRDLPAPRELRSIACSSLVICDRRPARERDDGR